MSKPRTVFISIAWLLPSFACSVLWAANGPNRKDAGLRTWVDSAGKHQVQASLLSQSDDSVQLQLAEGKTIEVPVQRLSTLDQRYLKSVKNDRVGPIERTLDAFNESISAARAGARNPAAGKDAKPTPKIGLEALKAVPETIEEIIAPEQPMPADIVYVQVSRELVRKLLARPISRATMVNERIVGTPVSGTANLAGHVNLVFVPSHHRAIIDLTLNGQIQSRTVGHGGPVRVHSGGLTNFSALETCDVRSPRDPGAPSPGQRPDHHEHSRRLHQPSSAPRTHCSANRNPARL